MEIIGHILGFPRIGLHRELKYALENYWKGKITQSNLLKTGQELRKKNWQQQKKSGLNFITVGDFAWYDHVLTTSLMLDNIPPRHRLNHNNNLLDTLFNISRGYSYNGITITPATIKKWFNTNYHYIVPEFFQFQEFQLNWTQLFDEIDEAIALKHPIKPVLLGPMSYLWLGSIQGQKFEKLSLLPSLLTVYQKILNILSKKNIHWVQIDEPILVLELPSKWTTAFLYTYQQLYNKNIKLLLTTYFDDIYHQLNIIKPFKIDGLHVDLTSSVDNISLLHTTLPKHWVLSAGVINGRNIWKTNLHNWFKKLYPISQERTLWIGSSCSLLHSPIDLTLEDQLNNDKKQQLSFAIQKCSEIKMLCTALSQQTEKNLTWDKILKKYYNEKNLQYNDYQINDPIFKNKVTNINNITLQYRNTPYKIRKKIQHDKFCLPLYPTTTIGSFPQTKEIRNLRLQLKNQQITEHHYSHEIKRYIQKIITEQENLDLDVLVHGEPERNDMVEYFGENLNGFIFTQHGWVQSYGSRCVKPPIIFEDISRPHPITIKWINYAQSLTNKPVKGILTGPVTLMTWSFIREDIQRQQIALQLSFAIRAEVIDLEKSGIKIIQIDEPALREGLPLKHSQHKKYLEWAVHAFKLTVASVKDDTQIHTHMCYSEFHDIIHAIVALDADVISIESSRTNIDTSLHTIKKLINNNINEIGPGIYDIHSTNEPNKNEIIIKLRQLLQYIPKERLWVNPDCGLKTRSWTDIKLALNNMVSAAKTLRKQ